jgi:hypothetical protein
MAVSRHSAGRMKGPKVLHTSRDDRQDEHDGREPDHDDEPDYRRSISPKGYMHPEDLLRLDFPHAGLKDAAAK